MVALGAAISLPAAAQTPAPRILRMATSVDAATLDPHATNALFTYLVVSQIYESLTHRGDDLRVHPGLATAWQQMEPTRWGFTRRRGGKFAGGEDFAAADVVCSSTRALAPT
eukprot:gene17987-22010_t